MGKLENLFSGIKILEEVESPINGKLTVIRDFAWGVYIKGGGLTQSGGVVEKVWNTSLKETKKIKREVNKCLILGLGGGAAAKVVKKYWRQPTMTGVEIDPIMINLGEKYMGLKKDEVNIVIEDAMKFVKRKIKSGEKYDLIVVDMYVEDNVPKKFTTPEFYKMTKKLLEKDGIVVFNRLYYGEKRKESNKSRENLENIFSRVTPVYPEANIMFICN